MQAITALWTRETYARLVSPVQFDVARETYRGAVKRCQRCDIPLGAYLCPNPECQEIHGEGTGRLCDWCHEHDRQSLEQDDDEACTIAALRWS